MGHVGQVFIIISILFFIWFIGHACDKKKLIKTYNIINKLNHNKILSINNNSNNKI